MTLIDTVRKSATDLTATATERVTKATEAIDGTPLQAVLGVADTAVQQARTGRAQLETQDAVDLLAACGQHDDRRVRGGAYPGSSDDGQ